MLIITVYLSCPDPYSLCNPFLKVTIQGSEGVNISKIIKTVLEELIGCIMPQSVTNNLNLIRLQSNVICRWLHFPLSLHTSGHPSYNKAQVITTSSYSKHTLHNLSGCLSVLFPAN